MLLEANPASLFSKTADGRTILDLAREKATESHPNYALISEIERQIDMARGTGQFNLPAIPQDLSSTIPLLHQATVNPFVIGQSLPAVTRTRKSKRKRKPVVKQEDFPVDDDEPERCALRIKREETQVDASICDNSQNDSETANLLLHFSRHTQNVTSV